MNPVAKFGEPVRISPLIKFCRWSALFLGITYGVTRNNFLQRRADRLKNIREQRKAERLIREKEERIAREKQSFADLEAAVGQKLS